MGLKEPGLRGSLRSTSSVLPAFFDVTITNTNSPVQEGDILTVDYSADNTGDAQDSQDIRLEIDSVQEDVDPGVMLAGGASATGTLEWDTTDEAEAEYTATVLSDDDSDSVTVEIGSAIPDDVVSRPVDDATNNVSQSLGLVINSDSEYDNIAARISNNTEDATRLRVFDYNTSDYVKTVDISTKSGGDAVDIGLSITAGVDYGIQVDANGSDYTVGRAADAQDYPYTTSGFDINIVGRSEDTTQRTDGDVLAINDVGNPDNILG